MPAHLTNHPETSGNNTDDIISSVLHRLSLVDNPEAGFNRFTRLVCQALDVRVAMVSFVEERANRQFFKSAIGLPEGMTETTLDRSFCKIVTRTGQILAVCDARTDPRVQDIPNIEDLGVIAYLGAPIAGPSGERLGSLCAVDRSPRDWNDNEIRAMTDLAACVSDHIALRPMRAKRVVQD